VSWQRLESSAVDAELMEGQEARVADPLWLLGRQWQVGEFSGEDAASPLLVEATVHHYPVTRVRTGPPDAGGPVIARAAAGAPLETVVEREEVRSGAAGARMAAEAGLQLLRALGTGAAAEDAAAALRKAYPLALPADDGLDPVGRAQLALLARRSFDARSLRAALRAGKAPAGVPAAALDAWEAWYDALVSEPPPGTGAWDPGRMEYAFQVAAGLDAKSELRLAAPEYVGGHLDWFTVDLDLSGPDMATRGSATAHDLRVLPTPARFAGQAASRWWEVEDGAVSLVDLGAAPEDLARVAVAAYEATFGDDWFLVPCGLPAGVVARVQRVTVTDDYGEVTTIRSAAELDGPGRVWRFFELTGDASADAKTLASRRCPWLFLAPALPGVNQGRPVEEVVLRRDEASNLAWAGVARVEGAAGRTIDRAARARADAAPPPTAPEDAWRYLLASPVLEHQVPLVPVRSTTDGGLYLQRGRLATAVSRTVTTRGALGRILEPETALLIHDDEVPATGVRITRSWQMARQADGGWVLWMGRRKGPASPVRSPGLVFDEVIQGPPGGGPPT
jgi:hypothetical protein